MIRPIIESDIPRIRELQKDFVWELGQDFLCGWVAEEDGMIVAVSGFWQRAEGHLLIDPEWKSPEDRLTLLQSMHEFVSPKLHSQGVGEVWTFMDDMPGFGRKLLALGWKVIQKKVWGIKTDG